MCEKCYVLRELFKAAESNLHQNYIPTLAFIKEMVRQERIGDGHYMIYSGLIAPEDVFDAGVAEKLDGILLFGDDFSGFCGGFVTNKNWDLIEVDGCSDPYEPEMTFEEFIRGKINTYLAL